MASPSTQFSSGPPLALTPLEVFGGQASQQDLDQMVRMFAAAADRPDLIPQTFLAYLVDYIQTNAQIVASQIAGTILTSITPASSITAAESTTATSYADLATVGPQLTALAAGRYAILYGGQAKISSSADQAFMSVAVNGTASDNDAAVTANVDSASIATLSLQSLTAQSNTIKAQYRVNGGTGTFGQRKLIAIRYANI